MANRLCFIIIEILNENMEVQTISKRKFFKRVILFISLIFCVDTFKRMSGKYILIFSLLTFVLACETMPTSNKEQSIDNDSLINHQQSHANIDEVSLDSLSLELRVNFDSQTLNGSATWFIQAKEAVNEMVLDIRAIEVEKILVDGAKVTFSIGEDHPVYGQGLHIPINSNARKVEIHYHTLPNAQALQWLSGEQTSGGKPFLYTQSQAILARSWVPCMDLPAKRFTYSAAIYCEAPFRPLMSAENPQEADESGWYHFTMQEPIPSYLLALAAGELEYRAYDERCGVFAEPVVMDKAFKELVDLPKMMTAAEALYGPYSWGQYDVLFLPSSFPFGGMENPRLTFATPTILAGDGSLVSLVAHELAHSWSGNLVTNRTWNDFWLNEGFTVYFEQRIMESVYGRDYSDMLRVLGFQDLQGTLEEMGPDNPDTRLYLNLDGRDPDDGMSDIAYEKGRFFLESLEHLVGRERFDLFLKTYFTEHAFQTMTTVGFVDYLKTHLLNENPSWEEQANIEGWIYQSGIPEGFVPPTARAFAQVDSLSPLLMKADKQAIAATKNWTTHHWLHFIRSMQAPVDTLQLRALENEFKFSRANSEIANQWLVLAVRSNWVAMIPSIEEFLISVGRRKFLMPLYGAMNEGNANWKSTARAIYKKSRKGYHAVSVNSLDAMLLEKAD